MDKSLIKVLLISLLFSGCLVKEDSEDLLSEIGASTCISAIPVGLDAVAVDFSVPSSASSFRVKRSGQVVFETSSSAITQFIDRDLVQGQTYVYTCEALIDPEVGFSKVGPEHLVNLEDAVAPTFDGITNVTSIDAHSVLVEWGTPSGSVATQYRIFKHIGITNNKNDFLATPVATIDDVFARSAVIPNLGDEIPYSFRIIACNVSNVCDDNDAVESVTLIDDGPPTTTGISAINVVSGTVHLTAPWTDANGFVARRSIYRAEVSTSTTCPTDPLASPYVLLNEFFISNPENTPTNLVASGSLLEGSRYCFVVRDQDPLSQQEQNSNVRFIDIGDLTPPTFLSSLSLVRDSLDPEHQLFLSWTAMVQESVDPVAGASAYDVFISSAPHPTNPNSDPCETGTPLASSPVSSASFPSGTTISIPVSGLNPRVNHRLCVRARDSTGNVSNEKPVALLSTGDVTAPTFSGIDSLSFNNALGLVEFTFIVPSDSDIRNYQVTTIRTRSGVTNTPIILTKNFGALTPGSTHTGSITLAEASLIDNDDVTVSVDVCDDASPTFNTSDNCSSTAAQLSLTIPDATPPQNFSGITTASAGSTHQSIQVNWNIPSLPERSDYAGFRVSIVDGGSLTELNSDACRCTGFDCVLSPVFSCEVNQDTSGNLLDPHRQYELYVSAYDLAGNETLQYIPFQGGSAVTGFARAQDSTAPLFNAAFSSAFNSGVELTFTPASDDQFVGPSPNDNEVTYQIYRKDNVDFTDPVNPENDPAATLLTTVVESSLTPSGANLTYTDTAVIDGSTYFYHACALDEAGNRTCQTGAREQVVVTDTTPPVITGYQSDKQIGNGTWTATFTISDNTSTPDNLIVRVFKSNSAFPPDTGAPTYSTLSSTVTVNPSTGVTTFSDSGDPNSSDSYYTITVTDQAGQKATLQARDMGDAPIVSAIVPALSPVGGRYQNPSLVVAHNVTINGSNFSTAGSLFGQASVEIDSQTCTIVSVSDTQIVCLAGSAPNNLNVGTVADIRVTNGDGQTSLLPSAYTIQSHCDIHGGSPSLEGLGLSTDPYLICDPEDLDTINTSNLLGYFRLMDNIDLSGSSFNGLRDINGINFFFHGNDFTISNMTVDTFGTSEEAAFIANCNGTNSTAEPLVRNIVFDNATIRSGEAVSGAVVASKACGTAAAGTYMFRNIDVNNSFVTGQPASSSTGIAAIVGRTLYPTGFLNININNTTVEAPIAGPASGAAGVQAMGGLVGAALTSTSIGSDPTVNYVQNVNIDNLTLDGRGFGISMGGLIGSFTSGSTFLNMNVTNVDITNSVIRGSSGANSGFSAGGAFGQISGYINSIDGVRLDSTDVLDVGSIAGGFVGVLNRTENLVISDSRFSNGSVVGASGTGFYRGGFVGRIINAGRITTSYVSNTTVSASSSTYVGGFAGSVENGELTSLPNPPTIDNSYVVGIIVSGSGAVGGFFGRTHISNSATHREVYVIDNFIAGGASGVSAATTTVGAFAGSITTNSLGQTAQISNNYYLEAIGLPIGSPKAWEISGEIDALNGSQFQNPANFLGWDFTNIWRYTGGNYPIHQ